MKRGREGAAAKHNFFHQRRLLGRENWRCTKEGLTRHTRRARRRSSIQQGIEAMCFDKLWTEKGHGLLHSECRLLVL